MSQLLRFPLFTALLLPAAALAQSAPVPAPTEQPAPVVNDQVLGGYFDTRFDRVRQAQASQPTWMTPLATVTPRLEEEVRYDQFWEHLPNGGSLDNYDAGKGLELIPTTTNEIIIGALPYEIKTVKGQQTSGWADGPTVLIKQRLLSENAEQGDAVITAFLSVTPSAGGKNFTQHATAITPTIAAGKGWGDFDIQATSGVLVYTRLLDDHGAQWQNNLALQYHFAHYFWPEFEVNQTDWLNGSARGGKDQIYLTPGIILGRFEISGRVHASFGAGYQFAVSPKEELHPELDPQYEHNWILSVRVTF